MSMLMNVGFIIPEVVYEKNDSAGNADIKPHEIWTGLRTGAGLIKAIMFYFIPRHLYFKFNQAEVLSGIILLNMGLIDCNVGFISLKITLDWAEWTLSAQDRDIWRSHWWGQKILPGNWALILTELPLWKACIYNRTVFPVVALGFHY